MTIAYPVVIGPLSSSGASTPRYTVTIRSGPQLGEAGTFDFVVMCVGIANADPNVSYDGRYTYRYDFAQKYIRPGDSVTTLAFTGSVNPPFAGQSEPHQGQYSYRTQDVEAGWVYVAFPGEGGVVEGSRFQNTGGGGTGGGGTGSSGTGSGGTGGSTGGTSSGGGMKINHHITFTGPAFVPTSVDETSARETTGATIADVGVDPYSVNVKDVVADLDINAIEDAL